MELFKVICVTCQAKLSVRNAALIGEIVACPRCESMVLVEAPAAVAPAIAPLAQVEKLVDQSVSVSPQSPVADTPSAESPVTAEVANVSVPMAAAGNKAILWWVASFVIGASVTSAFLILRQGDETEPAVMAVPVEIASAEKNESSNAIGPEVTSPAGIPARVSPGMAIHEKPTAEAKASPPANSPSEIAEPTHEIEIDETITPVEASVSETPEARLVVESPAEVRVARKFDPLRYDLEQMDVTNLGQTEEMEGSTVPLPPEPAAEGDENQGEQLAREKPAVVRLSDDTSTQMAARSAESQLKHVVPAFAVKDMLLTDYLDFIGSISGVPISVAPLELQMAGISPGKHVSLDAQEISLDEALAQVLKPLRLEATTVGNQVVIVREDAERVRTIEYPLDDLLGRQASAEDFAEWIEQLIDPETWESAGGSGKMTASATGLSIEQAQGVHYQILLFPRTDSPRQSRCRSGVAILPGYSVPNLSAWSLRIDSLHPRRLPFRTKHSLADVFRYWQSELGLAVLVDWPELAKANLWPDSRVTCSITNEPWHAALDAVLTPLELGWRASPGGTIQITSLKPPWKTTRS